MFKLYCVVLFLVFFSTSLRAGNNIPLPFLLTVGDKDILSVNTKGITSEDYLFLCSGIEENETNKNNYKKKFKIDNLKVTIKHTCKIDFLKLANSLKTIAINSIINKSQGKSLEAIDLSEYNLNLEKALFFKEQYIRDQKQKEKNNIESLVDSNKKILKSIKTEKDSIVSYCKERFDIISDNDKKGIDLFINAIKDKKDINYTNNISRYNFLVTSVNKDCLNEKKYHKLKESVESSINKLNKYKEKLEKRVYSVTIKDSKEKSKSSSNSQPYWYLKRNSVICKSEENLDYQTDLIVRGMKKLAKNCYITTDVFDVSIINIGLIKSHIVIVSNDIDMWTYSEFVEKR